MPRRMRCGTVPLANALKLCARRLAVVCLLFALVTATASAVYAQTDSRPAALHEVDDGFFDALKARHIGPVGNRVIAVTGVPGDANTYFIGAASGGIFRSTDGGFQWEPVFDDQPASSIGALAVAPSDPNVVWAGTGETFIRANISIGNGVYKSTDGGTTWQHMGLDATGRIGRVIIHPTDPDTVYVAALGHCYGPQEERGVYRTRDGGVTWEQVLFVSKDAGASDLVMDPNNPRILFAGTWEMFVNTWSRKSGGPGSGLWVSRDGGDSWQRLEGNGLPDGPWGKIGLTMSAADSRRVYALIETSSNRDFAPSDPYQGVLWRSDDGGHAWEMVSADNNLVQRPLYYSRALASPVDADHVHFMSVRQHESLDGGATNRRSDPQPGYDHHDMWIDPMQPQRRIVGHDGGISISTSGGESWYRPQLPIAQMYHAAVDDQIPYFVYGNRQDGPTFRVPSNTRTGEDTIPIGEWQNVGGCEVGFTLPTPGDPDKIWAGCYDGILEIYDHRTGLARTVSVWPEAIESWPAIDLQFRFQWTFPIAISPHDPGKVYVGSQYVHQTTDDGQSWQIISPDLTTDDPALQQRTGGLTLDDAGPTLAPTLFAIAESRLEKGLLWTGSNDGQIHLSRDGGDSWQNVTDNLGGAVPPLGTVSNIEPSRHQEGTAYVSFDLHQVNDNGTYVFKTEDYGQSWRSLRGDLPQDTFSYAHCVIEDPKRPGLLYLGTENAVWVSFDDGVHWRKMQGGLSSAPVHWLTIPEHMDDLVVATYGRGFWIVDDLTPLQNLQIEHLQGDAVLLPPRPAYRFRSTEARASQPDDPVAGENPQYGASLHYVLPPSSGSEADTETAEGKAPHDVQLRILDGDGKMVRELDDLPGEPGLHRVHWDLRSERTQQVKLRTRPLENPHVGLGDKGWRRLLDGGRMSVLMPPGTYTVELDVDGQTQQAPLEVRMDPRSAGREADIASQMEALWELHGLVDRAAAMINDLEWSRQGLQALRHQLDASGQGGPEVLEAVASLEDDLTEFEGVFFDLRMGGSSPGVPALETPALFQAVLPGRGHRPFGSSSHRRPTAGAHPLPRADAGSRGTLRGAAAA